MIRKVTNDLNIFKYVFDESRGHDCRASASENNIEAGTLNCATGVV